MAEYLDLAFTLDSEQLRQDGRDRFAELAPAGYVVDPWVDWLLSAVARMAVEVAVLAGQVPLAIFQVLISQVLQIPVIAATTATGTATFTLADTLGHTVAAGAILEAPDPAGGDTGITFTTAVDLVVAPGSSTGTVAIVAQVSGVSGSGLSGTVALVSPSLVWVNSVTIPAPTIGGIDGETAQQYVDRVADELPTFSPKAILTEDFAAIARADLEVFRALAIRNFVPPSTSGVGGAVTIALMGTDGLAVSGAAKTRVDASFSPDDRIANFVVYLIDPTFTRVDVNFTAHCHPGYDPAAVQAEAIAAIASFLAPATWGVPPRAFANLSGGGGGSPALWADEPTLRRNDLFGVLYRVQGIRHVDTLTLALHGGTLATADITLTGPASVPAANSVVTGTVSA